MEIEYFTRNLIDRLPNNIINELGGREQTRAEKINTISVLLAASCLPLIVYNWEAHPLLGESNLTGVTLYISIYCQNKWRFIKLKKNLTAQ